MSWNEGLTDEQINAASYAGKRCKLTVPQPSAVENCCYV